MLALVEAKAPTPSLETAALQDSKDSGQTAQRKISNKKRARSPEESAFKGLAATGKVRSMDRSTLTDPPRLKAAWESPWQRYEKVYDMDIAGPVEVAVRKASPIELVQIRTFSNSGAEKALHMFQRLQHRNLVAARDAFTTDHGLYVVLEHMPVSLEQIVRSPAYPNEQQLAAIIGQVSFMYSYKPHALITTGPERRGLPCGGRTRTWISTLLEHPPKHGWESQDRLADPINKSDRELIYVIANQQCCRVVRQPNSEHCSLRALSFIMMELMQKYVKEDGAIGIDDLGRWHSSSDAVEFLSATTSATSATELLRV